MGVPENASAQRIARNYRTLAKRYHPDLHPAIDPARMEAINEAWEVLGDPYTRAAYDRTLHAHSRQEHVVADAGWPDLEHFGFVDWRGLVPRVVSSGSNLWGKGATTLDPLRDVPLGSVWGLHLAGNPIGDDGLAALADLEGLRLLDLANTDVTDRGMRYICAVEDLEDLSLWGTAVTDECLKDLRRLRHLRNLNLGETAITDASIDVLAAIPELRLLNLRSTSVTADALMTLADVEHLGMVAIPRLPWRDRRRVGKALGAKLV